MIRLILIRFCTFLLSLVLTAVPFLLAVRAHANFCHKHFQEKGRPWFQKINFSEVEHLLAHGKVVAVKNLHQALEEDGKSKLGSTVGLALVTFSDGTKAVWKPGKQNRAETAAYKAAHLVKSNLIPPTVDRIFKVEELPQGLDHHALQTLVGVVGSLQYFVQTPQDLKKLDKKTRMSLWKKVPAEQKAARDIFNFVFGNWDLHLGNILIDDSGSLVQIDNGMIRTRMQVRYGELPFVRRLNYSEHAKLAQANQKPGRFPFDEAILLENPTVDQFVHLVKDKAEPVALGKWAEYRIENFKGKSLTMKVAFWDNGIWIQSIGFQNYGVIKPKIFDPEVIQAYRGLTFQKLREIFPPEIANDRSIREMLERRDQILQVATHHE